MRQALAPVLFDDEDKAAAEASRASPVAKAQVSDAARKKACARLSDPAHGEVLPVHSFRTLLADLGTLTKNTVCFGGNSELTVLAKPTPVQNRARIAGGRTGGAVGSTRIMIRELSKSY